jgi:hypothetical protein
MSGPFNVGDVVVYVDDLPTPNYPVDPDLLAMRLGHFYRVEEVTHGGSGVRVSPSGLRPREGFYIWRFRHLPKADSKFAASMRALRPIRVGEPA